MEYILNTKAMRIPVADITLFEINLRVTVLDSDLNIEGLMMEYRLPFAEKNVR